MECFGRAGGEFGAVDLGADDGVRADHDAFAALDAEILVPGGDELRDVALLPLGGAGGEGSACGNCADGERIALAGGNLAEHAANKLGSVGRDGRDEVELRGCAGGQRDLF